MSADVIRFPVVPNDTPPRPEELMDVVTDALCRMNILMAVYLQPGNRPSPDSILMAINEILEEPALCEPAGIDRVRIIDHDEGA
jgi:hypothetical protein